MSGEVCRWLLLTASRTFASVAVASRRESSGRRGARRAIASGLAARARQSRQRTVETRDRRGNGIGNEQERARSRVRTLSLCGELEERAGRRVVERVILEQIAAARVS